MIYRCGTSHAYAARSRSGDNVRDAFQKCNADQAVKTEKPSNA